MNGVCLNKQHKKENVKCFLFMFNRKFFSALTMFWFLLQRTSGGVCITVLTVLKWATEARTAQIRQTVPTAVASTPRPQLHLECLSSSSSFCLAVQVKPSLLQIYSIINTLSISEVTNYFNLCVFYFIIFFNFIFYFTFLFYCTFLTWTARQNGIKKQMKMKNYHFNMLCTKWLQFSILLLHIVYFHILLRNGLLVSETVLQTVIICHSWMTNKCEMGETSSIYSFAVVLLNVILMLTFYFSAILIITFVCIFYFTIKALFSLSYG